MTSTPTRLATAAQGLVAADSPLARLELTRIIEDLLADARTAAVAASREDGATWEEIGLALGISKQAACKRYGVDRADRPEPTPRRPTRKGLVLLDTTRQIIGFGVPVDAMPQLSSPPSPAGDLTASTWVDAVNPR